MQYTVFTTETIEQLFVFYAYNFPTMSPILCFDTLDLKQSFHFVLLLQRCRSSNIPVFMGTPFVYLVATVITTSVVTAAFIPQLIAIFILWFGSAEI